jgi:hypothetical protein
MQRVRHKCETAEYVRSHGRTATAVASGHHLLRHLGRRGEPDISFRPIARHGDAQIKGRGKAAIADAAAHEPLHQLQAPR